MKLLPDDLLRQLEAQHPYGPHGPLRELYQDEELVLVRLSCPGYCGAWYLVSVSQDEHTEVVTCFGLVESDNLEVGYFTFGEMLEVSQQIGTDLKLDGNWEPIPLMRLLEELEYASVH